ncbi:MAG: GNAT family protein [Ferruginibacter sp.]
MVRLERFEQGDFQQLIEWINDEELLIAWSGNLFSFPLTQHSLEWYISDTNEVNNSTAFVFKVVDEDGKMIGHISLGSISWKDRSARLTRVLVGDSGSRGKGYCYEMVKAVLKIAFEELKLHRVGLGVYGSNPGAVRCYERAGFITEGVSRDIMRYKNNWLSMIEMSILEDEWRQQNAS